MVHELTLQPIRDAGARLARLGHLAAEADVIERECRGLTACLKVRAIY